MNYFQKVDDNQIHFFLLVFSTVLIAAAGNIINDYFDVKADRINKPEKLIITKYIERRWAILTHWIFNGVAFLIAIYLSIVYESLWFVFVHLAAINILWFYSMLFKRKFLIGNIMIAALTSAIPLLVVIYFSVGNHSKIEFSEFSPQSWTADLDFTFIYWLAAIAFFQNLSREIIKDAQDVKGDEVIRVKSMPMVIGIRNSLIISASLLLVYPISFGIIAIQAFSFIFLNSSFIVLTIPLILAVLVNLVIVIMIITNKTPKLKLYDLLIKITMLIGVASTFYIPYFIK